MAAIEDFLADAKRRMDRSIEATHNEFNSIRTGRASPALLDRVTIDYYGTPTPLKNMSTISAPEPRLLSVQPYDPTQIRAIESRSTSPQTVQPDHDLVHRNTLYPYILRRIQYCQSGVGPNGRRGAIRPNQIR